MNVFFAIFWAFVGTVSALISFGVMQGGPIPFWTYSAACWLIVYLYLTGNKIGE